MILADKIIQLRKQCGWSQEELAEKLGVSRQSVSKWESAQSIPDLNKIIKLTEIFGVSTDFLLKDEVETAEFVDGDKQTMLPQVSLEQSQEYINSKLAIAHLTVKGVCLCVCSPAPLMFLLAMVSTGKFALPTNIAVTLGLAALLAMVAVAVGFFIRTNQYQAETAPLDNNPFELSYGVHGVITEKQSSFQAVYHKRLSIGVALFICSVIPFLGVAILSGRPDMVMLMLVVLFILIAAGLVLVVPASARFEAHKLLLSEGNLDADKSEHTKNAERLAPFYWPLVIAIYLGWSLWTMNWGITWIVFPVAAVGFAAMVGLMGLLKKDEPR